MPSGQQTFDSPAGDAVVLEHGREPARGPLGLSGPQWRSGIAAWLGWLFDGLDMHIYTLVAAPFVAELIRSNDTGSFDVKEKSAWIQAAFLVGWALGGGFFGRVGDLIGRSRTLALTIATYACFTGLSFFAQNWQQLLVFRFLAALGIGGEWAVGSSLLSETWPPRWRAWVAAVLQTGVNVGVLLACAANWFLAGHHRGIFLVGVAPALLVFWIRRHVPEPAEWSAARDLASGGARQPGIADLFRGRVRRTTLLVIGVCACSLTGWWAFMFWHVQHLRTLPEIRSWDKESQTRLVTSVFFLVIGISILGNFVAAAVARAVGYRRTIVIMCLGFFIAMFGAYRVPRDHVSLLYWLPWIGFFSGVFALFTMYLPPLFPTLLRTTGAGFSYNIGRIAAAAGTVAFWRFSASSDADNLRQALFYNSFVFIPAMLIAILLPDIRDPKAASQVDPE